MALGQEQVEPAELDSEIDEEEIVARIFQAVVEQRLPPGTKLSESALCEAFKVGRMRIRRSLLLLASREVVELHPNRGAFVASPSARQAREVFEVRQTLETAVAKLAVQRATPAELDALEQHLRLEHAAHASGDRREAIRLSGEFHIMLAEIAGNAVMLRMVRELVTRTSLIIGIFGTRGISDCRDDEHAEIMTAFRPADAERAADLMCSHLEHIEANLNLDVQTRRAVDIVGILGRG